MMRWIAAPLVALVLFGGSGFLDALEKTTEESLALAESSEEAPKTTAEAAGEVKTLPALADLTERQATAFRALSEALKVSAGRVAAFNGRLDSQTEGLRSLAASMRALTGSIGCIRTRIDSLLEASRDTPGALAEVSGPLERVTASQNKSIRHLKSINRKLTALGVVAGASGVQVPPPPEKAPPPQPGRRPAPLTC
jgi:chromosome segregation ATPase